MGRRRSLMRILPMLMLGLLGLGCPPWFYHPRPWPAVPELPSPPPPTEEFSVVWKQTDLNGMPYNPQWGAQRDEGQIPPLPGASLQDCVRQPFLGTCTFQSKDTAQDTPIFPMSLFCALVPESKVHGHVDWMPATYHGFLQWIHIAVDGDYNFALFPDNSDGITTNNNPSGTLSAKYIELEFDSLEVGDNFVTPTWRKLADLADNQDSDGIKHWLNVTSAETPPQAVVAGLFNLDCEHDCRSELHPVYALAIETNDSLDDNTWAIFVRNWGDGGFCSSQDHLVQFSGNKLVLLLPNTGQKAPAVINNQTEFAASPNSGIQFSTGYIAGQGLAISFNLPSPQEHALAELVLHLSWPAGTPSPASRRLLAAKVPAVAAEAIPGTPVEAEDYLDSLFSKINPAPNVRNFSARAEAAPANPNKVQPVPPSPQIPVFRAPSPCTPTPGPTGPCVSPSVSHPTAQQSKFDRDRALVKSLCEQYKAKGLALPTDRIPNLQEVCDQLTAGNK